MTTRRDRGYAKRGLLLGFAIGALLSPAAAQELPKQPTAGTTAELIGPLTVGDSKNDLATPAALPAGDIARRGLGEVINPLWAAPLASFHATRERPLFSPTRRPAPPPVQVPAPAASNEPNQPPFVLLGAITGDVEDIAILRDEETQSTVRLRTGESHSGWVLQSVKGWEATLQRDHRTAVLNISPPTTK